jgi:hypothetical protein
MCSSGSRGLTPLNLGDLGGAGRYSITAFEEELDADVAEGAPQRTG